MSSEERYRYNKSNGLWKQLDQCNYEISKHPENIDAYENKARILWNLGKYEDAMDCSMTILSIKSNDGVLSKRDLVATDGLDILCDKGNKFYARQMYAESLLYFEKVIGIDPVHVDALAGKAVSLRELCRYEESLKCIDCIINIDPNYKFAKEGRDVVIRLIKINNDRITEYDKILADDPKDVDALTEKGISLNSVGMYTDAVKCFEMALAIMPDYMDAILGKAKSLEVIRDVCENA